MGSRSLVVGCLAAALAGPVLASPLVVAPVAASAVPAVATSTTSLVISSTRSAYGQTVTATAAVATSTGRADGDVYFTLDDGVAKKVNLSATGTASLVLRDGSVGAHTVTATFAPQFPQDQQGSTSPAQPWTVEQVRTRLFVKVQGRGLRIPTAVRVEAGGEFGSAPTGRVTLALARVGSARTLVRAKELPVDGVVVARYGTLQAGRYRSVVTYAGDAEHLPERRVQWFRVRQL